LVNLSTTTRMYLYPPRAVLKGPTESSPHMEKGKDGGIVLRACVGTCCCLAKN
jgi:hypothetical protein